MLRHDVIIYIKDTIVYKIIIIIIISWFCLYKFLNIFLKNKTSDSINKIPSNKSDIIFISDRFSN